MMIDDYDFISLSLKTYMQNGRAEAWARVLFVISFTPSTLLPTTGTVSTFMRIQWNNVSYALSETPNGCQARMPPMLLANVK